MNVRRIIAAAAITGALAALPITLIATSSSNAASGSGDSKSITSAGGQGGWPLRR